MTKFSFVIPCYKSEKTISIVVEQIIALMTDKNEDLFEIILVNDFPSDNTINVIKKLCKMDQRIKAINFSKNFGQHSALMAGYKYCSGEIIISLDDDGETPVSEVYKLIDKINEGYDIVFAAYSYKVHDKFRLLGSNINKRMTEIMIGKPKDIEATSYFAAKKYIIDEILKYNNPYPYIGGLLFRTTNNIENVNVEQKERISGKTGYTFKSLLKLWLNGFTAFSVKPLRIATFLGVICALVGFVFGVYVIVSKIIHPEMIAGYSSTMAVLLFIGGMIMLMLGMIGEYIGRIYISINNSPQYVIREKINIDDEEVKHVR